MRCTNPVRPRREPETASHAVHLARHAGHQFLDDTESELTTLTIYQSSYIFPAMKELQFIGSSKTDLAAFPEDAKREAGFDLWQAQPGLIGA